MTWRAESFTWYRETYLEKPQSDAETVSPAYCLGLRALQEGTGLLLNQRSVKNLFLHLNI